MERTRLGVYGLAVDPNEALKLIRSLTSDLVRVIDNGTFDDRKDVAAVSELCDAVIGLDEWLSSGGFKPEDWKD